MTIPQLSEHELAHTVEMADAYSWAAFYLCAPPDLADQFDIRAERVGSAVVSIASRLDTLLFNRVIGLGIEEPATEKMVDEVLAFYLAAGLKHFAIQLSPLAQPAALPGWLQSRGLAPGGNWSQMYRGVEPPPKNESTLRVQCITEEHASEFSEVICSVYQLPDEVRPWVEASVGQPRWWHYIAFHGKTPVATAALFVEDNVGWLGLAATRPEYRHLGAQRTLMLQRIRDSATLGCRWLVAQTEEDLPDRPNASYHNMLRAGFKLAYQRSNYVMG